MPYSFIQSHSFTFTFKARSVSMLMLIFIHSFIPLFIMPSILPSLIHSIVIHSFRPSFVHSLHQSFVQSVSQSVIHESASGSAAGCYFQWPMVKLPSLISKTPEATAVSTYWHIRQRIPAIADPGKGGPGYVTMNVLIVLYMPSDPAYLPPARRPARLQA